METSAAIEGARMSGDGGQYDGDRSNGLSPQNATSASRSAQEDSSKKSATQVTLIMVPICLSVFLSSLDLTIITPAIPAIVNSFHSVTGYVWIGAAYTLASTAVTPVWASVADIWGRKPVILSALMIFLSGSLVCAVAHRMDMLIGGRSIQGLGASGMSTMVNVIICDTFSLRDRGLYLALTSCVWAVGSAVGPIIGGSFTTRVSWRWCFWINLPIGAVVFLILFIYLRLPSPRTPILKGLKAIDWAGSLLIIGAATMVLLGLDFGDVTFPWSSATVICLIVVGIATMAVFIINELKFADNPVIPLRLFTNQSIVVACMIWACIFYILVGLSFYLPLYSQSVLGANALLSGVQLIPLIASCSLAAAIVGTYIQKTGKYIPVTFIAHGLLTLGTGLFLTLKPHEHIGKFVVFQIITGVGIGMNLEPPLIAAQAALTVKDTAVIQATMTFIRSLATTIAVVLGGVIFQNRMNVAYQSLVDQIGEQQAAPFNGTQATASVELIRNLSMDQRVLVENAYFTSLRSVWIMFVVVAGLSLLSNFFLRAHHLNDVAEGPILGTERSKPSHTDQMLLTQPTETR